MTKSKWLLAEGELLKMLGTSNYTKKKIQKGNKVVYVSKLWYWYHNIKRI